MRTISEAAEDIKSILNNVERTEECTGETLVDINELVDEILTINCFSNNTTEIRNKAIDEMQDNLIRNSRTEVIDGGICLIVTDKRIKQIAEQMKGGE